MNQYQIAVIVGSLRRDSYNQKLAKAIIKLAPAEFTFKFLKIDDLPLSYLDVRMLCQPEAYFQAKEGFFDEAGNIGENSKGFVQGWMDQFVDWVKKH